MSSYGLIETTMNSKEKLCIDYALKPWPIHADKYQWSGFLADSTPSTGRIASDPLKPTFSAIVRLPPQSIDKKIYPCVFHGSRSVERNHYLLSILRIDINEVKFIIAAAGNKERLL